MTELNSQMQTESWDPPADDTDEVFGPSHKPTQGPSATFLGENPIKMTQQVLEKLVYKPQSV